MEKQFVIDRISSVMGSCENVLQLDMAKKYSERLMDVYNSGSKGVGKMPEIKNAMFRDKVELVKKDRPFHKLTCVSSHGSGCGTCPKCLKEMKKEKV